MTLAPWLRRRWLAWLPLVLLGACLAACGGGGSQSSTATPAAALAQASTVSPAQGAPSPLDLTLAPADVALSPLPLRAGFPFTVTAVIHNNAAVPAVDVPIMVYLSASQEQIGFAPFLEVLSVTLQPTQTLAVQVPVRWNLSGGEHQLWVQVNRLPRAWQSQAAVWPEEELGDNSVLRTLLVEPFDAYTSALCAGRVDVEVRADEVRSPPDLKQVVLRVYNLGNRAVFNLPVVVLGNQHSAVAYSPAIPPCGGTAEVVVAVDEPFAPEELLTVQVNPSGWEGGLPEDDYTNNQVSVRAGAAPEPGQAGAGGVEDYDFAISSGDLTSPEPWILLVTVHNLGTRDADMVPIRIENAAGRKIADAIPIVLGNGQGVAAVRVGYLWTRGGTLTVSVNPAGARGAYPEPNRDNNQATFSLP